MKNVLQNVLQKCNKRRIHRSPFMQRIAQQSPQVAPSHQPSASAVTLSCPCQNDINCHTIVLSISTSTKYPSTQNFQNSDEWSLLFLYYIFSFIHSTFPFVNHTALSHSFCSSVTSFFGFPHGMTCSLCVTTLVILKALNSKRKVKEFRVSLIADILFKGFWFHFMPKTTQNSCRPPNGFIQCLLKNE